MWKRLLLGPDCLASRSSVGIHMRLFGTYGMKLRLLCILTTSIWGEPDFESAERCHKFLRRAKWERKKGHEDVPDEYLHKRPRDGFNSQEYLEELKPSRLSSKCWMPPHGWLIPKDAGAMPPPQINIYSSVRVLCILLKKDREPESGDQVLREAPVVVAAVASVDSLEDYLHVRRIAHELGTVTKYAFKMDRVRADQSSCDAVRNLRRFSLEFWPYVAVAVMVLWTGFAGGFLLMPSFLTLGVLRFIDRTYPCSFARRMFVETRIRILGQIAVERNATDLRRLLGRKSAFASIQQAVLLVSLPYSLFAVGMLLCLKSRKWELAAVFFMHLVVWILGPSTVEQIRYCKLYYASPVCLVGSRFIIFGVTCAFHVVVGMYLNSRWALIALLSFSVVQVMLLIASGAGREEIVDTVVIKVSPSAYLVVCLSYGLSSLWVSVPLGLMILFVSKHFSYRVFKASGFVTLSPEPWLRLIKSDIPRVCCYVWNLLSSYVDLLRAIRNPGGWPPSTGRRKRLQFLSVHARDALARNGD